MIRIMELRHLRYFLAVAEEQNFHRAAARLHVSQSPLSRQVQDLEDELGVELLEPRGRGVTLTEAGRRFAERARTLLRNASDAATEARDVAEGRLGTVSIGFETGTALAGQLMHVMLRFRQRMPGIKVQLAPMSSAEQWEALRSGQIAFGYGFYPPSDGALAHQEISKDRLGVVMATHHRLAGKKRLSVSQLKDERVLLPPRRQYPRLHDDVISATRKHGIVLDVVGEVLDGEALLTLVAMGDAVSFFADTRTRIILSAFSEGFVTWKPVDWDVHESDVLMWRKNETDRPVVRALLSCARDVIKARR